MRKIIDMFFGNYKKAEMTTRILRHRQARKNYYKMHKEAGATPEENIPWYEVWSYSMRIVFLAMVAIEIMCIIWMICVRNEPKILYFAIVVGFVFLIAVFTSYYPASYWDLRGSYKKNLVYIHFYSSKVADILEKDVAEMEAKVSPWLDQKAKEEAERKEKEKAECVEAISVLSEYIPEQFGFEATYILSNLDNTCTIMLPNPEDYSEDDNGKYNGKLFPLNISLDDSGTRNLGRGIAVAVSAQAIYREQKRIMELFEKRHVVPPTENEEAVTDEETL